MSDSFAFLCLSTFLSLFLFLSVSLTLSFSACLKAESLPAFLSFSAFLFLSASECQSLSLPTSSLAFSPTPFSPGLGFSPYTPAARPPFIRLLSWSWLASSCASTPLPVPHPSLSPRITLFCMYVCIRVCLFLTISLESTYDFLPTPTNACGLSCVF